MDVRWTLLGDHLICKHENGANPFAGGETDTTGARCSQWECYQRIAGRLFINFNVLLLRDSLKHFIMTFLCVLCALCG